MIVFGVLFLALAASVTLLLLAGGVPRPVFAHAIFAMAALPLMLAAILHFVPVLTRSRGASSSLRRMPWLALASGAAVVTALFGLLPWRSLLVPAVVVGILAVVAILWILRRMAGSLGAPHPGVRWYVAALVFLGIGMVSVFGMVLDEGRYLHWRNLHLHANLFGWIGLTALGTLPVLLPTTLQMADPGAAVRLRRDLPVAVGGVLLLIGGAALTTPWLSIAGAVVLVFVPLGLLRIWWGFFNGPDSYQGAAASLAMATLFLVGLLIAGIIHALDPAIVNAAALLPAFVFGFLMPLMLGALVQLVPVWRFPGPGRPERDTLRHNLAKHAAVRGSLCVLAGVAQFVGISGMAALAAVAVVHFCFVFVRYGTGRTAS